MRGVAYFPLPLFRPRICPETMTNAESQPGTNAMITAYLPSTSGMERVQVSEGSPVPTTALWIDLYKPTNEEREKAERLIGAHVPTAQEMSQIETSERLYEEAGALVMTTVMPMAVREPDLRISSLTFVLNARRLVTVRHGESTSVAMSTKRAQVDTTVPHTGPGAMFLLLDAIIDRAADEVEKASAEFDAMSLKVFEGRISARKSQDYKEAIRAIGQIGLKVARMHDVCATMSRLLLFLSLHRKTVAMTPDQQAACKSLGRDIHSIREHADSLDNKLNFLLDATVGLVTLEQNQIIKIFSVLAVIFLPPTLIASIYGMNFAKMPELHWSYGYPFSIGVMVLSVFLTFLFFRWRKLL